MTTLRVAEAQAAILDTTARQPSLRLPLADAIGHRLAEDVIAPWPLPMWTAASMDGYAVMAADVAGATAHAPRVLRLAGGADAGDGEPPALQPGTAWRVATGGRVPVGADSVVRQEDVRRETRDAEQDGTVHGTRNGEQDGTERGTRDAEQDGTVHGTRNGERVDAENVPRPASRVTITSDRDAERNVRPAGGDIAQGSVVLHAGTLVTPAVVAMLAALGEASPLVYRKPRVAILCSGNEVASLDQVEQVRSGVRIADVNGPMLSALVREAGGVPVSLGLVTDDAAIIAATIAAATDVDLLLTAGGISVGVMDHIMAVMEQLHARVVFRRVRLRPGGPTTHAVLPDGRHWLALPGNPVSAFVTFHLFAAPAIRAMSGDPTPVRPTVKARLAASVTRDAVLDQYLRVQLQPTDEGEPPWAHLTGNQGSWVLSSILAAEGLAVAEAGEGEIGAGGEVAVIAFARGRDA